MKRSRSIRSRWPRWVYGCGEEPDYRFSFANERTFLAWIRTALALIAGGVALEAIDLPMPLSAHVSLVIVLVSLGIVCAVWAWARWARAERAMRRGEPLPTGVLHVILAVGVMAVAVIVAAVVV